MFVQQIYTGCLSQASYYIESNGYAAIVDPMRDVNQYMKIAYDRSAKISYVLLTHFHADFVSGHLELARKTGAKIILGPNAKPGYEAHIAKDQEKLCLGSCKIEVLHTPGHTIESACFLLYDEYLKPYAIFTGDTLFIGDVGRPDLMSGNMDAEDLARLLYESIQVKIKTLPDDTIVYPGHGAGSACGKNLANETVSTIGEQKKKNYAFQLGREDFIEAVTTDQPFAPAYFFKDARINVEGYENLDIVLKKSMRALTPEQFKAELDKKMAVLDTRNASDFGKCFVKGSVSIGLDGQFALWAGTILDFNAPLLLVTEPGKEEETIIRLARIGYENIHGYLRNGIASWTYPELKDSVISISADEWISQRNDLQLIDVRRVAEFEKERLPGSLHIPLEKFRSRIPELDKYRSYAIYCAGGYRSMIAASLMKKEGVNNVLNISGGIAAVKKARPELVTTF